MQFLILNINTSYMQRYFLLLSISVMMSFSISAQFTWTPRVSYNWANYTVNECFFLGCSGSKSSNIGIGVNVSRPINKRIGILSGINLYTHKVSFFNNSETSETSFRHFDVKFGMENTIFNENTFVGVGLQLEVMHDIERRNPSNNEIESLQNQFYYGFELTTRHRLKNIDLFFDAFFNLNVPNRNSIVLLYHTSFQVGIGYPINAKKSKALR